MLGDIDRLTMPHPRQHFTGVVAQVSQADGVFSGAHGGQCITILWPLNNRMGWLDDAVEAIASIAEARNDVADLIQPFV
jgi:hypothetical protein